MQRQSHLHFSRGLRRNLTPAEAKLWGALRKRSLNGHRFNRQFRIGPYTVDFICREKALVVEVDGDTHSSPEERADDRARANYLRSLGYTVFRVDYLDIYCNLDGVLDSLLLALERRLDVFSRKAPIRPSGTFPSEAGEG